MDVERVIAGLRDRSAVELRTLLSNAVRVLEKNTDHAEARRLQSAVESELARRKLESRMQVGALWWEPHDPDVSSFSAYADRNSMVTVAVISKEDTHTYARKDVYTVRVGDRPLDARFSEVAAARQAGSDAWERHRGTQ